MANSVHNEEPYYYEAHSKPTVLFSHGLESGPWGDKIVALADVAKKHGFKVESIDYRGMSDPEERVKHLLDFASELQGAFILVGSSMGGYVSLRASSMLPTVGIFLLAPAVGLPGYQFSDLNPGCKHVSIIHAWQDEIIPVHNVINFAETHKVELHLVNSDHRLSGQISLLTSLFSRFLTILSIPTE